MATPSRKRRRVAAAPRKGAAGALGLSCPVHHALLGLSPTYWCHVPLTVRDVLNLRHVNGVDCLVVAVDDLRRRRSSNRSHRRRNDETTSTTANGCSRKKRPRRRQQAIEGGRGLDVDGGGAGGGGGNGTGGDEEDNDVVGEDKEDDGDDNVKIIPLSRCHLHGIVVNVERRSNGSILYVLDDGTGLIDCLAWDDSDEYDSYGLPSLLLHDDSHGSQKIARVGDTVSIRGKIRCLSAGSGGSSAGGGAEAAMKVVRCGGMDWEVHAGCAREVHVTTLERIGNDDDDAGNREAVHWLRCVEVGRRAEIDGGADDNDDDDGDNRGGREGDDGMAPFSSNDASNSVSDDSDGDCDDHYSNDAIREHLRRLKDPLRNGADVLHLLGPEVASNIASAIHDNDDGDDLGILRGGGGRCRCDVPYKDDLLYCHCHATTEVLDPTLTFRDALLGRLLEMERDDDNGNGYRDGSEDHGDGDRRRGAPITAESSTSKPPLKFEYRTLVQDPIVSSAATRAVSDTAHPAVNIGRLYRRTFGALRKDGVLHLIDETSDTYLLLSRERVLEPYVRRTMATTATTTTITASERDRRGGDGGDATAASASSSALERAVLRSNPPAYVRNVPRGRLRAAQRRATMTAEKQKRGCG